MGKSEEHQEQICANCTFYEHGDFGDDLADGYCNCEQQVYSVVFCDDYCFRHQLVKEEKK